MGAIPYDDGVAFRVWAPFAQGVAVAANFNGWSADADTLVHEGNGYWSADVGGARPGQQYKFVLSTPTGRLWRNDPHAREVTNSAGNSVIYRDDFDWGGGGFTMPPWDELVVYELHVGTFNDVPGAGPDGFAGVIDRLDHLVGLGVTAIELLPSAEFATDFSWGYNPTHIFAIEQAYGGLGDVAYNHFGPSDLDLWRFDG